MYITTMSVIPVPITDIVEVIFLIRSLAEFFSINAVKNAGVTGDQ